MTFPCYMVICHDSCWGTVPCRCLQSIKFWHISRGEYIPALSLWCFAFEDALSVLDKRWYSDLDGNYFYKEDGSDEHCWLAETWQHAAVFNVNKEWTLQFYWMENISVSRFYLEQEMTGVHVNIIYPIEMLSSATQKQFWLLLKAISGWS